MMTAAEIGSLADQLYPVPEVNGTCAALAEHYRALYCRERFRAVAFETLYEHGRRCQRDADERLSRLAAIVKAFRTDPDEDDVDDDDHEHGDPGALDVPPLEEIDPEAVDYSMPNIGTDATRHEWVGVR